MMIKFTVNEMYEKIETIMANKILNKVWILLFFVLSTLLSGCGNSNSNDEKSVKKNAHIGDLSALDFIKYGETYNPESVIPPQCYTQTEGKNNPCYVCHQSYHSDEARTNMMGDGDLQGNYEFSDVGMTNSWRNLFVDRTEKIEAISDEAITSWVNIDNYKIFVDKLEENKSWKGEIPKLDQLAYPARAFNENGLAKDGSGWVAFNYKPFPSTFWPTNGSTGDVMIRLADDFKNKDGQFNLDVYYANLALLEMAMKGGDKVTTIDLSEKSIGQDINGNDEIEGSVFEISKRSHYLGDAANIELVSMLYPKGTEFLHTVRYIAIDKNGKPFNAPRMKEVRYMKKLSYKSKNLLSTAYYREAKEKDEGNMPKTVHIGDRGIDNGFGWVINGYIEDGSGELRQQHEQELEFCNGCHKTVGTTYDQTFSFARKLDGRDGWGYIDLTKLTDAPNQGEEQGEYLTYMQRVGGGDEFRQNREMLTRWFNEDGRVNTEKVESVNSLYELIMPSAERALALNKAYKTIVDEQSFLFGRDTVLKPAINVLQQVDDSVAPLQEQHRHQWDMRLDWHKNSTHKKVKNKEITQHLAENE